MTDFVPYHPVKLRRAMVLGAVLSVALAGWSLWRYQTEQGARDVLRAGLAGGLAAAMGVTWYRFRPREGWGVRLTDASVQVSRPRGAGVIEVSWSAIREVRRLGDKRDTLGLFLDEHERVLVPAHLFASAEVFEALGRSVDERLPAQRRGGAPVH